MLTLALTYRNQHSGKQDNWTGLGQINSVPSIMQTGICKGPYKYMLFLVDNASMSGTTSGQCFVGNQLLLSLPMSNLSRGESLLLTDKISGGLPRAVQQCARKLFSSNITNCTENRLDVLHQDHPPAWRAKGLWKSHLPGTFAPTPEIGCRSGLLQGWHLSVYVWSRPKGPGLQGVWWGQAEETREKPFVKMWRIWGSRPCPRHSHHTSGIYTLPLFWYIT